jgi:hypothetical protein
MRRWCSKETLIKCRQKAWTTGSTEVHGGNRGLIGVSLGSSRYQSYTVILGERPVCWDGFESIDPSLRTG